MLTRNALLMFWLIGCATPPATICVCKTPESTIPEVQEPPPTIPETIPETISGVDPKGVFGLVCRDKSYIVGRAGKMDVRLFPNNDTYIDIANYFVCIDSDNSMPDCKNLVKLAWQIEVRPGDEIFIATDAVGTRANEFNATRCSRYAQMPLPAAEWTLPEPEVDNVSRAFRMPDIKLVCIFGKGQNE